MTTPDFVLALRSKIGHDPLWMPGVKGVVLRPAPASAAGAERDVAAEVLLVRRADNGCWTVPAGILEPGEEPADGITREVLEETGVSARVTRLVGVQTTQPTTYPNGDHAQYLDVIMALDPLPGSGEARVNDDENLEVAWRSIDDLADVPPLHVRAVRWAADQDPRFAVGGRDCGATSSGWFVEGGRERQG
ncbi:NUDIX domain-containing protein [Galactobacter sp.]|uniref:NUDIX hydrolase n=1 Tax=Galactobacter sp. TaxID=2676125 RepID=UPI0025C66C7C|nr:NUDIX domain-containing protein [Galactobacter sp.]